MLRRMIRRSLPQRSVRLAVAVAALFALPLAACGSDDTAGASDSSTEQVAGSNEAQLVVLLDVRAPDEYAAGHLDGAINLDYEGGVLEQQLGDLDPSVTYQVYCRSGRRSALAVELLTSNGFTSVVDLGSVEAAAAATGLAVVVD